MALEKGNWAEALERATREAKIAPRPSTILEDAGITLIPSLDDGQRSVTDLDQSYLGRYQLGRELGRGGMGRVVEAFDPELKRTVAVKMLLDLTQIQERRLMRFLAEAQVTSQLQHPAIVPVHDFGVSPDGVLYYVMKRISGRSLREVLAALAADDPDTRAIWTDRKLLTAFVIICEAVAYANSRGVIHRDLKPDNIMLGAFGEVLVLDWGVARVLSALRHPDDDSDQPLRGKTVEATARAQTRAGSVIGTIGYMSPEQAMGAVEALDARSDVWALGAILFEILTHERAYPGQTIDRVLSDMLGGPPRALSGESTLTIPDELADVAARALSPKPSERPPTAEALAEEIRRFLEGRKRRDRAEKLVRSSLELEHAAITAREEAARLAAAAKNVLVDATAATPLDQKAEGWRLEEESIRQIVEAEELEAQFRQSMRDALDLDPTWSGPHHRLAEHLHRLHRLSERTGDGRMARRTEALLRIHNRGRFDRYLRRRGAVSLFTEPTGASVELWRYREEKRLLRPSSMGSLGITPSLEIELEIGSYLAVISAPGRAPVRYPFVIERGGHWNGVAPGDTEPTPIRLPLVTDLASDDCFIAAGWTQHGGDPHAAGAIPGRKLWVDGFVIKRDPVTIREYLDFLDALHAEDPARAKAHVPVKTRLGDNPLFILDGDGYRVTDEDEARLSADMPVTSIAFFEAVAYAEWRSKRESLPWRLPTEVEWEKAARGADGREFPFGSFADTAWINARDRHSGRDTLAPVDEYPTDVSPYGVRGLAGNASDWCADPFQPRREDLVDGDRSPPIALIWPTQVRQGRVMTRGAGVGQETTMARSARRGCQPFDMRHFAQGFRLARSVAE